jgi:hypothetical protein
VSGKRRGGAWRRPTCLFRGNGNGTFQAPVFHQTMEWPQWLAVGDLNRTGHADLVADENSGA